MDEKNHIVSGIYTSCAEAESVRDRLLARGLPLAQTNVVNDVKTAGNTRMAVDDIALKDVLVDGSIGAAVGTGVGALAEVALVVANVSLFVASPLIAPLAMLGWGAALGGVVGAVVGAEKSEGRTDGKFSDLVLDAIRSGHVVLIAHTRSVEETAMVREVIGDSVLLRS